MQILGASIEPAVDAFLHAGYGSIVPPSAPLKAAEVTVQDPRVVIDVAQALELQGTVGSLLDGGASGVAGALGHVPTVAGTLESALAAGPLLAGVLIFFGALSLAERAPGDARRRRGLLMALAVAALAGIGIRESRAEPAGSAPAATPVYVRPAEATEVILHGLLRDALMGINREVKSLEDLRPEVGLPRTELTAGEAHALAHPELDGWGRPFRMRCRHQTNSEEPIYTEAKCDVASAGADGVFGTTDDPELEILAFPYFWRKPRTVWVGERGGEPLLFVHRWPRPNFQWHNRELARELTGGELFDVLTPAQIRRRAQRRALREVLARAPAPQPEEAASMPRLLMVRR